MDFDPKTLKNLPEIPSPEELIDVAFRRALRRGSKPEQHVQIAGDVLSHKLRSIVKAFPDLNSLPPFYLELIKTKYSIGRIRRALAGINWAAKMIDSLKRKYIREARKRGKEARREFFGRAASIVRKIGHELEFLEEVRRFLREFPVIKNVPTVVIFGYPNVGKSSLLKALSGSDVEIAEYPFTTKKILIGYTEDGIQLVDTPGVLRRSRRNPIEKEALVALKYLGDLILFLVDPTETCGFPLRDQLKLLEEVKKEVKGKKIIVVATKKDLWMEAPKFYYDIAISVESGEGINEILKLARQYAYRGDDTKIN